MSYVALWLAVLTGTLSQHRCVLGLSMLVSLIQLTRFYFLTFIEDLVRLGKDLVVLNLHRGTTLHGAVGSRVSRMFD